MLKFALYCTCNLHLNVVRGFSVTILEDDLVQVRNKSLGAVDKDWEWFLPSLLLICLPFATSLVVVVSPGQDKHAAIKFCFLTWVATETNHIFEHRRDICVYYSHLYMISLIEKYFKDNNPGGFFKL